MREKAINLFLDMMAAEKGAAANTLDAYKRDLEQFFEVAKVDAENINAHHISDFLQYLGDECFSPKTQARRLSALKEFCRFLYIEKIISENAAANVTIPKQDKPLPKYLTTRQIKKLITAAKSHNQKSIKRIGVMIALMYATGLRVSELVSLSETAINHDKKILIVRGKGSKERMIPVSVEALKDLNDYEKYRNDFMAKGKQSSWLFPSKRGGHIDRTTFFKQLKQLALECDLNPELISPHTLRHSFATNLITHEADLRSVQKMLGHENITTTEIYTHITSENLIEKVQLNHPLSGIKLSELCNG